VGFAGGTGARLRGSETVAGSVAAADRQANAELEFFATLGPEPELGEVWAAAYRQHNLVYNVGWAGPDEYDDPTPEGWDPVAPELIEGYEDRAGYLLDARNPREHDSIKRWIDQQKSDRKTLYEDDRVPWYATYPAMFAAGVSDPLVLIPFVGLGTRAAIGAGQVALASYRVARSSVLVAGFAEAVLHANQSERTVGESFATIGGAALIGGLLGGGTALLSKRRLFVANREADEILEEIMFSDPHAVIPNRVAAAEQAYRTDSAFYREKFGYRPQTGKAAGAMVDKRGNLIVSADDEAQQAAFIPGLPGGSETAPLAIRAASAMGIPLKRFQAGRLSPMLWMQLNSSFATGRAWAQRLAPSGLRTEANLAGGASGQVVVSRVGPTDGVRSGRISGERIIDPEAAASANPQYGPVAGMPDGTAVHILNDGKTVYRSGDGGGPRDYLQVRAEVKATVPAHEVRVPGLALPRITKSKDANGVEWHHVVDPADGKSYFKSRSLEEARAVAHPGQLAEGTLVTMGRRQTQWEVVRVDGSEVSLRRNVDSRIHKKHVRLDETTPTTPRLKTDEDVGETALQGVEGWYAQIADTLIFQDSMFLRMRLGQAVAADPRGVKQFAARQAQKAAILKQDAMRTLRNPNQTAREAIEAGQPITRRQFKELAGRAMRTDDTMKGLEELDDLLVREGLPGAGGRPHYPEVDLVAQRWRKKVIDPLKDEAILRKLLPEGVTAKGAASYLTRVFNSEYVVAHDQEFRTLVRHWMRGLEENRHLNDGQIDKLVDDAVMHIQGQVSNRIGYSGDSRLEADPRKVTQQKTLLIPDNYRVGNIRMADFLENDIEVLGRNYFNSLAPDVELARVYGDGMDGVNGVRVYEDMIEEQRIKMQDLLRMGLSPKEIQKARKAIKEDFDGTWERFAGMRDRLRGTYGAPAPENVHKWRVRVGRIARQHAVLGYMGGVAVSSIPDLVRAAGVHGMKRAIGDGLYPLMKSVLKPSMRRAMTQDLRDEGIGLELVLDLRAAELFNIGADFAGPLNRYERVLKTLSSRSSMVNLLAPWNRTMKQYAGIVTQARMVRAMKAAHDGTITPKEMSNLQYQGISPEQAKRMWTHYEQWGQDHDGFFVANHDMWGRGDVTPEGIQAAADAKLFAASIRTEVNRIIVTPDIGDKPLWTSTELGRTIFQFKSFAIAATQRIMISSLQQKDMAALNGIIMLVGVGSMVSALKQKLRPEDIDDPFGPRRDLTDLMDDPLYWILEGVDRSGIVGIFTDGFNIADKFGWGPRTAFGMTESTRYAERNQIAAVAGASYGTAASAFNVIHAASPLTPFTQSNVHAIRRLLPFQNVFYLSWLFDAMEAGAIEAFDIPKTASSGRRRRL